MDEIVKAAMAKWPNVPDCVGWLGLDARGDWWMRDDRVQAQGPFSGEGASQRSKGVRLQHDKLLAFIGRNYGHDEHGCWFFQNGPQRVFVELELAPWVWRLSAAGELVSHTGIPAENIGCCLDEAGHLYVNTDLGLGVVHSQDMWQAAEQVECGQWQVKECLARDLPHLYGFVPSPWALRQGDTGPEAKKTGQVGR